MNGGFRKRREQIVHYSYEGEGCRYWSSRSSTGDAQAVTCQNCLVKMARKLLPHLTLEEKTSFLDFIDDGPLYAAVMWALKMIHEGKEAPSAIGTAASNYNYEATEVGRHINQVQVRSRALLVERMRAWQLAYSPGFSDEKNAERAQEMQKELKKVEEDRESRQEEKRKKAEQSAKESAERSRRVAKEKRDAAIERKNLTYVTDKEKYDILSRIAERLVGTFYSWKKKEEDSPSSLTFEEDQVQASLSAFVGDDVHLFRIGEQYLAYLGEHEELSGVGMRFTAEELVNRMGNALLRIRWEDKQEET